MQRDKAVRQKALGEFRALPTKLGERPTLLTVASLLIPSSPAGRKDDTGSGITNDDEGAAWCYPRQPRCCHDGERESGTGLCCEQIMICIVLGLFPNKAFLECGRDTTRYAQ